MREHVRAVHLIEVDGVDVHAAQRCFTSGHEIVARGVIGNARDDAALCSKYDSVAQSWHGCKDTTKGFFASTKVCATPVKAIHISIIYEVDAEVNSGRDRRDVVIIRTSEAPAAQGEWSDGAQAAEISIARHVECRLWCRGNLEISHSARLVKC